MTIRSVEDTVAIIKDEILHDIHQHIVPHSVRSFSELHDYVDANCYGGFCGDKFTEDLCHHFGGYGWFSEEYDHSGLPQGMLDYINACQNAINDWLAQAGHLLDDMQDQTTASML